MEYNIQKYQFHQNGKDYLVSTGLVGDKIRITCQENLTLDGPFYCNEFSLYDLRTANQFFRLTQSPQEALIEINKGIERQKTALKEGANNTMNFIGYLIIGTDNDIYNLVLRRDLDPNRYGIFNPQPSTGASDLLLTTNYRVDGERIKLAEKNEGDLQREQTLIEEQLSKSIPEVNRLKKISIDIEEENALIRERIKILQRQLEQRKLNVLRLKQENANLKNDNHNLNVYIKNQENIIREKQAMQENVKIQTRPNISPGPSAVASRFDQPALRTFLPRAGVKPTTEEYNQYLNYTFTAPNPIISTPTPYVQTEYVQYPQTQYITAPTTYNIPPPQTVQTIYPEPQIIMTPPQNLEPSFKVSPQKQLRNSNYSVTTNVSYTNPTYRAYLNSGYSGSREVVFKNRVNDPNRSFKKDLQTPHKDNINNINALNNSNRDIAYTSPVHKKLNSEIPLSNKLMKSNSNSNITNNKMGIGNTLNNANNDINYNSQMANIGGKIDQGYNLPKGSRMPKANLGNYNGEQYGSKKDNIFSKKSNRSKSPDVGYSSYKPNN